MQSAALSPHRLVTSVAVSSSPSQTSRPSPSRMDKRLEELHKLIGALRGSIREFELRLPDEKVLQDHKARESVEHRLQQAEVETRIVTELRLLTSEAALERAVRISDVVVRSNVLATLAAQRVADGQLQEAYRCVQEIPGSPGSMDAVQKARAIFHIVKSLIQDGLIRQALLWAETFPTDDPNRDHVLEMVARAYIDKREYGSAKEAAQHISTPTLRGPILQDVVLGLAVGGHFEQASEAVRHIKDDSVRKTLEQFIEYKKTK